MHDRRDAVVSGLGQRWWCIGPLANRTECYSPGAYGQNVIVPGSIQDRML